MKLRTGHTYRIYDGDRFTLAIGGNYIADGSHRRPVIDVIDRKRNYARIGIPLPHFPFYRGYRFRKIGGLVLWRAWHRLMRKLCKAPKEDDG